MRGPVDSASRAARWIPRCWMQLVRRQVLEPFDHRNLNAEVAAFRQVVPTSENLGQEIYRRLKRNWSAVFPGEWPRLEKIRIAETSAQHL